MEKTLASKPTQLSVKTVMVNDKQSAAFLVADLQEGQQLAVVDKDVLNYLTKLLPTASFEEIKHGFIEKVRDCLVLEALVLEAHTFVTFHESVNLLKTFFDVRTVVNLEKPFNVAKPKPTIDELVYQWQELEAKIAAELGGNMSPDEYSISTAHREWFRNNKQPKEETVAAVHPRG